MSENPRLSFLVFSDDWGEHPSSCQHIFKHLVKDYPVVWVNTVGMRPPRLSKQDAVKAFKKLKRMFFTTSTGKASLKLPKNLSVLQPFMLPYNKGLWRKFNRISVIKTVRKELSRRGLESSILVTTVPNACDYIGAFNERRVIYYCVDDFANWPGHDKKLVLKMEEELIKRSNIFIATSEKLFSKLSKFSKPTYFLPHGVDLKKFQSTLPREGLFNNVPKPRAGYIGLVDKRLDLKLIRHLAQILRDISFVFIGKTEIGQINDVPNIFFLPPVSYKDVPSVLKSLDVLILPYQVNEFTQTLNPLKLKEYLASGKPIVGSPLKEIEKWQPFLKVAQTPEEWAAAIREALTEDRAPLLPDLYQRLAREDWSTKAQEFLQICLEGFT